MSSSVNTVSLLNEYCQQRQLPTLSLEVLIYGQVLHSLGGALNFHRLLAVPVATNSCSMTITFIVNVGLCEGPSVVRVLYSGIGNCLCWQYSFSKLTEHVD